MDLSRKVILALGSLLILTGFVSVYLFFFRLPSGTGYSVQVSGNSAVSSDEISRAVTWLLATEKSGLTPSEIANALELNPRIASAKVSEVSGRRLTITIRENPPAYLVSNGSTVSEFDANDRNLDESVSNLHPALSPDIPIFYLTGEKAQTEAAETLKRDIIRLYLKSRMNYGFVWQRISEIEILEPKTRSIRLYAVRNRARIRLDGGLNEDSLRRLWATFYYLESQTVPEVAEIELQENSSVIREAGTNAE